MMRRCLVHILLSLVLLVSQQMAFAHALTHWTGQLPPVAAKASSDSDLSSSVAQDQSCSQCLAFAQLASVIGSSPRQFVPLDLQAERVHGYAILEAAPRTVCVFHSRAPPSFV
jgi:hypothetical protein